jgi:transposase
VKHVITEAESELSWKAMTIGLDLSDRYSTLCVLDSVGDVIEEGRVRTTEAALTQRFGGISRCRIVLEVGTHSPWVSRLLADFGHELIVANPGRVRMIADSTKKNDRSDAETLARLGRLDPALLHPITHRSQQAQADLAMIRARRSLVGARTVLINHVRGAVKSSGARLPSCDAYMFHKKVASAIPEHLSPALTPLLTVVANLTSEIANIDARLCAHPRPLSGGDALAAGAGGRTSDLTDLRIDDWRPLPLPKESSGRCLPGTRATSARIG